MDVKLVGNFRIIATYKKVYCIVNLMEHKTMFISK